MGHSLLGGVPASRTLVPTHGSLAARRGTRLADARSYTWVTRCSAGYPPRGRSFLHMGHSLLGGIPASRRSFLHMGHSLLGGIPASRRSFLRATRLAPLARRRVRQTLRTRPAPESVTRCSAGYPPRGRSFLHMGHSLSAGYPPRGRS